MSEVVATHDAPSVRAGVVAGSVGLVVVVAASIALGVLGSGPTWLDAAWYDLLATHRVPVLETVALALNYVGGTLSMTIVSIVVVVVLLVLRQVRAAIIAGLSVGLATGISTLIKLFLGRPRPPDGTVDLETSSFPSGHATAAAALTIAIALLFSRVWVWVLAAAWIVLMALSRTYLLVHWATDVLAGAVLGASVALLVFAIVQEFVRRRRPVLN